MAGESVSILCISDMHVGHKLALMPPVLKAFDVNANRQLLFKASKVQLKIWDEWAKMCKDNSKVDYLVINGDLCDGVNYHGRGEGCWSTEAEAQVAACNELLDMVKARRTLITQGSGYHTGHNPSLDAYVANKRGAAFDNEIMLAAGGLQFWFKHEVPISSSPDRRPNTLAGAFRDADYYEAEYGRTNVVVRGHAHYYVDVRFADIHGVVLPGWKGKDAFQAKLKSGYVPELGWVRFDVTGSDYETEAHVFTLKGANTVTRVS